jgi:hypothetical protein
MSDQHDHDEGAEPRIESIHAPSLSSSGLPPLTAPGGDATADAGEVGAETVEDAAATSGIDPDLQVDAGGQS